ncbi:MAG: hypothetical protein ACR2JP_11070 [Acidimicrobiia bacterium]
MAGQQDEELGRRVALFDEDVPDRMLLQPAVGVPLSNVDRF